MGKHAGSSPPISGDFIDRAQLALETTSWLTAWLILPAWLGIAGVGFQGFVAYCVGAGLLLSAGVAADRAAVFHDLDHLLWFTGVAWIALLVIGGAVFAISSTLAWMVGG